MMMMMMMMMMTMMIGTISMILMVAMTITEIITILHPEATCIMTTVFRRMVAPQTCAKVLRAWPLGARYC